MILSSLCLTWDGLDLSQTCDLPIEDAAPPAEGFEELCLLLVDNVLHHVRVFPQLWESIALESERKRKWEDGEEEWW